MINIYIHLGSMWRRRCAGFELDIVRRQWLTICALLAQVPPDAARCQAAPARCLAPRARCCTPLALPRDARTLLRAACRLPNTTHKFFRLPRSLLRVVCALSRAALRRPVNAVPLCIEWCRWPHTLVHNLLAARLDKSTELRWSLETTRPSGE